MNGELATCERVACASVDELRTEMCFHSDDSQPMGVCACVVYSIADRVSRRGVARFQGNT